MDKIKKPSNTEQFSLLLDTFTIKKLRALSDRKGIPINTLIKIILNDAIEKL